MLGFCVVSIAVLISSTSAAPLFQNGEYVVPNDTAQCANDLIEWCNGLKFPSKGDGMSLVSLTIAEPDGLSRYFCVSNSEAANCTKDGSPWISCSNDHQFFYKGQPIMKGSQDGVDDKICQTADRAFNDVFVQNLSADNSTSRVDNELESFFRQMQHQLQDLQDRLSNMFGPGFPFGTDDSRSYSSEDSDYGTGVDQIEKE